MPFIGAFIYLHKKQSPNSNAKKAWKKVICYKIYMLKNKKMYFRHE